MELDSEISNRPDRDAMGPPPLQSQAGEPGQQAQAHDHRGGHRPGRRVRRGHPGRAGLQRQVLLLPGFAAPRALHRRAGRHQRRQELPQRRRQRLPPVLRHGEGRRFPLARIQRLPPGADQRSTSSTSAWRRACRSRASIRATWTTARFGGAQVSRTFYARGQTGQQLLLGAYQALERQIGAGRSRCSRAPRCST